MVSRCTFRHSHKLYILENNRYLIWMIDRSRECCICYYLNPVQSPSLWLETMTSGDEDELYILTVEIWFRFRGWADKSKIVRSEQQILKCWYGIEAANEEFFVVCWQ